MTIAMHKQRALAATLCAGALAAGACNDREHDTLCRYYAEQLVLHEEEWRGRPARIAYARRTQAYDDCQRIIEDEGSTATIDCRVRERDVWPRRNICAYTTNGAFPDLFGRMEIEMLRVSRPDPASSRPVTFAGRVTLARRGTPRWRWRWRCVRARPDPDGAETSEAVRAMSRVERCAWIDEICAPRRRRPPR